jgi:hypothetical protein
MKNKKNNLNKILFLKEKLEKYKHITTYLIVLLGILFIFLIFVFIKGDSEVGNLERSILVCGDDTFNETCSFDKPYYCENGVLVRKPDLCGCPDALRKNSGKCSSIYGKYPRNVSLNYVLMGEKGKINFVAYKDVVKYLESLEKGLEYPSGQKKTRADFKLKVLDDRLQRAYLMPLVKEIQNLAPDNKLNQARIAISLVQNIPYAEKQGDIDLGNGVVINPSRYPYEVVYSNKGVCGEKVELLAFLLREIGYGTSLIYYLEENHEALGIRCPVEESYNNTGYCFVETTGPSIISDSGVSYGFIGGGLSGNYEIYLLSDGISLPENIQEYEDAEKIKELREKGKEGEGNIFDSNEADVLNKRYGLEN